MDPKLDQNDLLRRMQARGPGWMEAFGELVRLAAAAGLVFGISAWMFTRPATAGSVTRLETLTWGAATPLTEGSPIKAGTRLKFES